MDNVGSAYYCGNSGCDVVELNYVSYNESENAFTIGAEISEKFGAQSVFSIDAKVFKKLAVENLDLVEKTSKEADALFDVTFGNAFFTVVMFYFIGKSVGLVLSFIKKEALN